jgi:hypothetical protein
MGELRCGACAKKGMFSRVLLRYAVGSITSGGRVVVRCRDCKAFVELTTDNQHCDGINTFVVSNAAHPVAVPRSA